MKSAFDLAMERLGGPIQELSAEQKAAIQELEAKYKAKVAEAELAKDEKISKAQGNYQQGEQILEDFVVEIASINSWRDQEKKKIRGQE